MNPYSQLKPAWHLDRLLAMRRGKFVAPVHVQLVLSDLCNHDCDFCAYRISNGLSTELFKTPETHNPNRRIDTDKAAEIIHDCAQLGVKAIQFTGGGEPTVHKDHLELFSIAQSLELDTALVTNGAKLDVRDPAVLAMTWIRISVDAGTEATYCETRRVSPAHWRTVWSNIEQLARTYTGTLGVGFVVTPHNYREIGACALRCKSAGVKSLRVGAVFSADGAGFYVKPDGTSLIPEIREEISAAKTLYDDSSFEVISLFDRRVEDLWHGAPKHPHCGYQRMTLYIGADLNLYRCCNTAYTPAGLIGNISREPLRRVLPAIDYTFDARSCRFCQFNGQNETINALLERPTHANFV